MNPVARLLIVDDDEALRALLADYLARFSFVVHLAADGAAMHAQLQLHPIDLVVLDLMLPGVDGLALARGLRSRSTLPIVMLSARAAAFDRVLGLENGADDYLAKPFEPRELVARIQTVLRRVNAVGDAPRNPARHDVVCFDGWELHRDERRLVAPDGVVAALSNAEFRLLSTFLEAPRRLLTRDQLMELARGRGMESFERSIDLLVSRLRQKLADNAAAPRLIKTVRGAGYLFNARSVQGRPAWRA